ncbi:hypothetical protein HOY82DRAFT_573651 [Tuber indicum]|nr:hypothetical protein HOY82DRAFT_573651 [Tuber indicum]
MAKEVQCYLEQELLLSLHFPVIAPNPLLFYYPSNVSHGPVFHPTVFPPSNSSSSSPAVHVPCVLQLTYHAPHTSTVPCAAQVHHERIHCQRKNKLVECRARVKMGQVFFFFFSFLFFADWVGRVLQRWPCFQILIARLIQAAYSAYHPSSYCTDPELARITALIGFLGGGWNALCLLMLLFIGSPPFFRTSFPFLVDTSWGYAEYFVYG